MGTTENIKRLSRPDFIEKLRSCFAAEEVEKLFSEQEYEDLENRINFLKEVMGVKGIRYFGRDIPIESKYHDLLIEFERQDWRFYQ